MARKTQKALFEVMHTGQPVPSSSSTVSVPKGPGWMGGMLKSMRDRSEKRTVKRTEQRAARQANVAQSASAPAEFDPTEGAAANLIARQTASRGSASSASPAAESVTAERSSSFDRPVPLERHRGTGSGEIRLSYPSALATLAAVAIVALGAFMIGRMSVGTDVVAQNSPGTTETTGVRADVLKLGNTSPPPAMNADRVPRPNTQSGGSSGGSPIKPVPASPAGTQAAPDNTTRRPPQPFPADARRVVGRNYVIVQSYPAKGDADAAQSLLAKAGVPCTVEYGLKDWTAWYSVVGLTGFDSTKSNPQYDDYVETLVKIGQQTPTGRVEPRPYAWRLQGR